VPCICAVAGQTGSSSARVIVGRRQVNAPPPGKRAVAFPPSRPSLSPIPVLAAHTRALVREHNFQALS
jgi:hypothetical protein